MNRGSGVLWTLAVLHLFLTGCYNNGHVRSQRILEPGDRILSVYSETNVWAPNDFHDNSHSIDENGVNGMRVGVSYLGFRKGLEQGLSAGIGFGDEGSDFILGYELRKVKYTETGKPLRYGLYLESNTIPDDNYYFGQVTQLRPYLMTTTADDHPWYWGIHGLLSFGDLSRTLNDWIWDPVLNQGYYETFPLNYTTLSTGLGISLGNELRLGSLLLQGQLDISLINQQNSTSSEIPDNWDYLGFDDLDRTGLYATLGMAIHSVPKSSGNRIRRVQYRAPVGSSTPILGSKPKTAVVYDPLTGLPRVQGPKLPQFDPLTGVPIETRTELVFDPLTGLPMEKAEGIAPPTPISLLTSLERSQLILKPLQITTLNEMPVAFVVQDILDTGIKLRSESDGTMKTLPYADIRSISFRGGKRGFRGCMKGALSACGLCVLLPLAGSMVTGSNDLIELGFSLAPAGILGGMIVGSQDRETYQLNFMQVRDVEDMTAYRQFILSELIKAHVKEGFPQYELIQSAGKN